MEAQEILQDIYFILFYGGLIGVSVAAALYLLLRRGNAIAPKVQSPVRLRRWAAAFLMGTVLSHVFWVFCALHPTPVVYSIVSGLDMMMLFPTITGVLVSMLQDRKRPVWPVYIALAPALVLVVLCVIRRDEVLYLPLSIYAIALYASIILYMVFAVRNYGRWLRDNYADLENKEVWQNFIILGLFLLFYVIYSSTSIESPVLVCLLQIYCIIIVALLLWRVETLPQLGENAAPEAEPAEEVQKASAPPATPSKMDTLLKRHCEDKQLYLQNDLTLAQLAGAIGTNRTYLSQHFAQKGITYNAYINGLRVRHFINLYQETIAAGRRITAQQLASESGYRSYSTFSTAFKQHTGKNVMAWIHDAGE